MNAKSHGMKKMNAMNILLRLRRALMVMLTIFVGLLALMAEEPLGAYAYVPPTPFSGRVNPNIVIMQATTNNLQANFSISIVGVDPGSSISAFTDTASSNCTETLNSTTLTSATLTATSDGQASGTFLLNNCTASAPGYQTIGATGTVNGTSVTISSLASYILEGPRP
jgi:hypothetical protein